MSKLVAFNGVKHGLGQSTVISLLATGMSDLGYKVLVIDNTKGCGGVGKYLCADTQYTMDDIKPYVVSESLSSGILETLVSRVHGNIDVLSNSDIIYVDNTLNIEELGVIKDVAKDAYDFIFVDCEAGLNELNTINIMGGADAVVIVTTPNSNNEECFKKIEKDVGERLDELKGEIWGKSLAIVNFWGDDIKYKPDNLGHHMARADIFKIRYEQAIVNFCNGIKVKLSEENEQEILSIANRLTSKENEYRQNRTFMDKLKGLFNKGR